MRLTHVLGCRLDWSFAKLLSFYDLENEVSHNKGAFKKILGIPSKPPTSRRGVFVKKYFRLP